MAIQLPNGTVDYLEMESPAIASPAGGYLSSVWIQDPTLIDASVVLISFAAAATDTHYNTITAAAAGGNDIARSTDTTNANANFPVDRTTGVWEHLAGSFTSASYRRLYNDGVAGTANTATRTQDTFTRTKVGSLPSGTNASTDKAHAEFSQWDTSGMDQADIDALAARLATLVGGSIIDPRIISAEVGGAWNGRLRRYWRFNDITDLNDLLDSGDNFVAYGSPANFTHPAIIEWREPLISGVTSPYVEGSTITVSGQGFNLLGTGVGSIKLLNGGSGTTQTVTDETDPDNIEVTAAVGNGLYGVPCTLQVTTEQGQTADYDDVTIIPANPDPATTTGERYVKVDETPATAGLRITATPDLDAAFAAGRTPQIHWKNAAANAGVTPIDIDEVVIYGDGSISITTPGAHVYPIEVDVRVNLDDGEGWSAFVTQSISEAAATTPVITGADTANWTPVRYTASSFTLANLVSSGSWTWSDLNTDLPAWATLNINTGEITGTPNVKTGVENIVIRVTGAGGHVDLTLNIYVVQRVNYRRTIWRKFKFWE